MDFGGFSNLTTDLTISKDHLAHKGQLFYYISYTGGYHVSVLHKDLTANLDMTTYKVDVTDDFSVQTCSGIGEDRLGSSAFYVYLYPNFMINR